MVQISIILLKHVFIKNTFMQLKWTHVHTRVYLVAVIFVVVLILQIYLTSWSGISFLYMYLSRVERKNVKLTECKQWHHLEVTILYKLKISFTSKTPRHDILVLKTWIKYHLSVISSHEKGMYFEITSRLCLRSYAQVDSTTQLLFYTLITSLISLFLLLQFHH